MEAREPRPRLRHRLRPGCARRLLRLVRSAVPASNPGSRGDLRCLTQPFTHQFPRPAATCSRRAAMSLHHLPRDGRKLTWQPHSSAPTPSLRPLPGSRRVAADRRAEFPRRQRHLVAFPAGGPAALRASAADRLARCGKRRLRARRVCRLQRRHGQRGRRRHGGPLRGLRARRAPRRAPTPAHPQVRTRPRYPRYPATADLIQTRIRCSKNLVI